MHYSNVLKIRAETEPAPPPPELTFSNVLVVRAKTEAEPPPPVEELELSNVLRIRARTAATDLAITGATDYRHASACSLTVENLSGSYAVYWSPTPDHTHAGAAELEVTGDDLTGGSGTITVTAARGVVLYGAQGYLVLVDAQGTATRQATLLLETHKRRVTLVSPLTEDLAERLNAIPNLAPGDTVIWFGVQPSSTFGVDDVEVFENADFKYALGVETFFVEAYDASTGQYSNVEIQTIKYPQEEQISGSLNATAAAASSSMSGSVRRHGEISAPALPAQVVIAGAVVVDHVVHLTVAAGRRLESAPGVPVTNLDGITWLWYDDPDDTNGEPVDGGVLSTNAEGEALIHVEGSSLGRGQEGGLLLLHPTDKKIRGWYRVPIGAPE